MFTATLIGDTKNIELRRRMINVEFTDGTITFAREFQFRIDETVEGMKKAVKSYLDEINLVPPTLDGDWTVTDPTPVVPTQAELDRKEWEADVAKLKKAHSDMIDLGVTLTAGQLTALTTLRNKIATNFKNEYLG